MIYIMGFNGTIVILINSGKPWIFDVALENDQLIDDKHYDLQNLINNQRVTRKNGPWTVPGKELTNEE